MKKVAILLAVCCISTVAFAQFEKGNKLVGGSFGLSFTTDKTKDDGTTYTNGHYVRFSLDPQVGYFVINNLAIGGTFGFSTESYKEDGSDYKSVDNEITIQPFVRYYLPQRVFFQGNFIAGNAKNKITNNGNTDETKYGVSGWSLSAGYAFLLNDHVAIEPQLGYSGKGYRNKENDVKYLDNGLYIRVGFQIYLGK